MAVENPLNLSEFDYIVVECFHIAGFVLAVGMTAIVDFRLLGLILPKQTPQQLASATALWVAGGLLISIFTGFMLFSVDPDSYFSNVTFLVKMICLCVAIAFNYTIHRKAVLPGVTPRRGKITACISLVLWIWIVCCGIFIANNLLNIG
ncbi:MAG TPA: DUF6644 family protein [Bryobacteraceae bacterium]|nr:DUF6644 family protein [Bryobacteraceae bacterium]